MSLSSHFYYTGTLLHYPLYVANPCPAREISMVDDSWKPVDIENLDDPANIDWTIQHRSANVFKDEYNDAVTVKIARDSKAEQVYSAGYWRTADFKDGGIYQVNATKN